MLGAIASLALAAAPAEAAPHRLFVISRDCSPVSAHGARDRDDRRVGAPLRSCTLKVGRPGRTHVLLVRLFAPGVANKRNCDPPQAWIFLYTGMGGDGSIGFNQVDTSDSGLAVDPGTGDVYVNTPPGGNTVVDINTMYEGDGSTWDQDPTKDVGIVPSAGAPSGCRQSVLGDYELKFCVPHANHNYKYTLTLHQPNGSVKVIDPNIINH